MRIPREEMRGKFVRRTGHPDIVGVYDFVFAVAVVVAIVVMFGGRGGVVFERFMCQRPMSGLWAHRADAGKDQHAHRNRPNLFSDVHMLTVDLPSHDAFNIGADLLLSSAITV